MVREEDLKVDVWRGSGPGGGSWGIRLTHIASGTAVAAEGEFAEGTDPEPAILRARADLIEELDARLKDA
jgi:protein subunit release factor A